MSENQTQGQTGAQSATPSRVVQVVTTRGEKRKINFEGKTWGELKELLTGGGTDVNGNRFSAYSLNNMKCVESTEKHTLEHNDALVPTQDFNLFVMPLKNKSGGAARDQVKALMKDENTKVAAKSHFGNYTVKREDELEQLLKIWTGATPPAGPAPLQKDTVKASKKAPKPEVKEAIASVVSSLPGSVKEKLQLIQTLTTQLLKELDTPKATVTATVEVPISKEFFHEGEKGPEETPEQKLERERIEEEKRQEELRKKKEKEESEALDSEMQGMVRSFDDVKRY